MSYKIKFDRNVKMFSEYFSMPGEESYKHNMYALILIMFIASENQLGG